MNTPVGGLPSSASPLYPAQDAASREADGLVGIMIRYCSDSRGRLNKDRLSGFLGRTIKLVELRTGVLPPTVSDATANNPVSHNPTVRDPVSSHNPAVPDPVSHNSIDPEDWQWDEWEDRLFSGLSERGISELKVSHRNLICSTLSGHIGPDEDKIFALLDHPHFEESLTAGGVNKKVDPLYIKIIVQNHKGNEMFSKLLGLYETKGNVMPAGLIKSAIALGYLPKKYIDKLFQLDCN